MAHEGKKKKALKAKTGRVRGRAIVTKHDSTRQSHKNKKKLPHSYVQKLGRKQHPPTGARWKETRATFEKRVDNNRS